MAGWPPFFPVRRLPGPPWLGCTCKTVTSRGKMPEGAPVPWEKGQDAPWRAEPLASGETPGKAPFPPSAPCPPREGPTGALGTVRYCPYPAGVGWGPRGRVASTHRRPHPGRGSPAALWSHRSSPQLGGAAGAWGSQPSKASTPDSGRAVSAAQPGGLTGNLRPQEAGRGRGGRQAGAGARGPSLHSGGPCWLDREVRGLGLNLSDPRLCLL